MSATTDVPAGTRTRAPAMGPWVFALVVLPWIVRALGDRAGLTDGFYAHGALMIAKGYTPYVDYTQVAFPLAEGLLAAVFTVLGPSLRVVELLNRLVGLAVAVQLHGIGWRLGGRRAGALAAVLYAWSTWVIGFDLFEREAWAALGTVLAVRAVLDAEVLRGRDAWRVAMALLLAVCVKITTVFVAVAVCAHLLLQGRRRETFAVGLRFAGLVLAVSAACAALWGLPFLWQVYLFGFFRNPTHDVWQALTFMVEHADLTLWLGLLGLVHVGLPRLRRAEGLLACILLLDIVYATALSGVIWNHNLLNLVPSCAVLAALSLTASWRDATQRRLRTLGALTACLAVVLPATRAEHFDWVVADSGFGFGFGRPRRWVQENAGFLREHSRFDEVISCVDPWVAFAADRVPFVRYWDLQPVARGVEDSLRGDGLAATLARRSVDTLLVGAGDPPHDPRMEVFFSAYDQRLYACGVHWVRPELLDALARSEIALVLEPLPPVMLSPDDLLAAGYVRFEADGLAAWRAPRRQVAALQPLYGRPVGE